MDERIGMTKELPFEFVLSSQIERICAAAGTPMLYIEHINNLEALLCGYDHDLDAEIQKCNTLKGEPHSLARRKFKFLMQKLVLLGFATKKTVRTSFGGDDIEQARANAKRYIDAIVETK